MLFVLVLLVIVAAVILAAGWSGGGAMVGGGRGRPTRLKDLAQHPRTRSEQEAIDVFEKICGRPFPTAYPEWLRWRGRPMELDGYNEELRVGVEFSGPLHTKFYPARESYAAYKERVDKDREKIRLCRENGVRLIVIDMSVPRRHLYNYIHSRLYDIGIAPERPFNYMAEVVAVPYENPQLEGT